MIIKWLTSGGIAEVSGTNPFPVSTVSVTAVSPISFRQTTTTGAVALPSNAFVNGVVLKSMAGNAGTIYIGAAGVTTATGYPLAVGEAISYAVTNSNLIYIIGSDNTQVLCATGN